MIFTDFLHHMLLDFYMSQTQKDLLSFDCCHSQSFNCNAQWTSLLKQAHKMGTNMKIFKYTPNHCWWLVRALIVYLDKTKGEAEGKYFFSCLTQNSGKFYIDKKNAQ